MGRIEAQVDIGIDDGRAVAGELRGEAIGDPLAQRTFQRGPGGAQQEAVVLVAIADEHARVALQQAAQLELVVAVAGPERGALRVDGDLRRGPGGGHPLFLLQLQAALEDAQALVQPGQVDTFDGCHAGHAGQAFQPFQALLQLFHGGLLRLRRCRHPAQRHGQAEGQQLPGRRGGRERGGGHRWLLEGRGGASMLRAHTHTEK